jgi:hypothetical protein
MYRWAAGGYSFEAQGGINGVLLRARPEGRQPGGRPWSGKEVQRVLEDVLSDTGLGRISVETWDERLFRPKLAIRFCRRIANELRRQALAFPDSASNVRLARAALDLLRTFISHPPDISQWLPDPPECVNVDVYRRFGLRKWMPPGTVFRVMADWPDFAGIPGYDHWTTCIIGFVTERDVCLLLFYRDGFSNRFAQQWHGPPRDTPYLLGITDPDGRPAIERITGKPYVPPLP